MQVEQIEFERQVILNHFQTSVDFASSQHEVLCNWGWTEEQSSAVHIQALVSADGILLDSSFKLRLLVINLASVPGGQLVNSPTAKTSNVIGKAIATPYNLSTGHQFDDTQ